MVARAAPAKDRRYVSDECDARAETDVPRFCALDPAESTRFTTKN